MLNLQKVYLQIYVYRYGYCHLQDAVILLDKNGIWA